MQQLRTAVTAIIILGLLGGVSNQTENTIVLSWNGDDGLVERTIAFRTDDLTEWASLWKPMFESTRSLPCVDFDRFEVVGIILPHLKHRPLIRIRPQYEESDTGLTLTLECGFGLFESWTGKGSQYAFAVIPKSDKRIQIRAGSDDLTSQAIPFKTIKVQPLVGDDPSQLPALPLKIGGGCSEGSQSEVFEVFMADKVVSHKGDSSLRLAHVMIRTPPSMPLEASATIGEPRFEGYGAARDYFFQADKAKIALHVEVNERNRTVTIADETYALEKGNFFYVVLDSKGIPTVNQLPIVRTKDPADFDTCGDTRKTFLDWLAKEQN